ncbi:hypothetical protein AGOR_G00029010 [Albula goreensis]|uniref:LRRN4 C-terminal-like protein n=1 Tax=Albula goreensis TaxID=1534307 RepID=A0A8T3E308_9TELE|nr:hypothetical protein AGOR_G00029010 [Albula goreensis]
MNDRSMAKEKENIQPSKLIKKKLLEALRNAGMKKNEESKNILYSDTMAVTRSQPYLIVPLILALSSSYTALSLAKGNRTETRIRPRILEGLGLDPNEDYDDHEPTSPPTHSTVSPVHDKPDRCDYDPCRDQQRPCADLTAESGCQCPGLSGPYVVPEAPSLVLLAHQGSGVIVKWCAPSSTITQYRIVVEGWKPLVFGQTSRKAVLKDVELGAKVCVQAENKVGVSKPEERSCAIYEPETNGEFALKAGLVGGALGFLLLLSLVIFLLWKHKAGKSGGQGSSQTINGGGKLKEQEDAVL